MKIFGRIPWRVFLLSLGAAVVLTGVIACGDEGSSPTVAPTQPSGVDQPAETVAPTQSLDVDQPTETEAPQADEERQGEEVAGDPTQEAPAEPTPTRPANQEVGGEVGDLAPGFQGIHHWINSDELSMEELRGQVVLIDFWTYTCVNCIRTLPYLKEWHAKYADKGLTIVGVHTPEFEFEKVTENVVNSVGEYGLGWAIAQDNDFRTWRAYSNRYWPAKYLVDQHGTIRYRHFGEGKYTETEDWIRDLLEETGADLSDVEVSADDGPARDPRASASDPEERQTREIYAGFQRNISSRGLYVFHDQYYEGPNRTLSYSDPGDHQNQFMYLQGLWTNGLESIRHARETESYEDYIVLKFAATTVNAVIDPEGDSAFDVQVTIDGRPLSPEEAGPDVVVAEGRSFFTVTEPRMYEVVSLPEFAIHELNLSSNSDDFALFAFTFGSYDRGP